MSVIHWRGRPDCFKQVGNARESFVDLTPVSELPAEQTRANWSAVLSDQDVPLIGEDGRYGWQEREDDC